MCKEDPHGMDKNRLAGNQSLRECRARSYGAKYQESPNYGTPEFPADLIKEMPDAKFVGAHCASCRTWEMHYFAIKKISIDWRV